MPPLYPQPAYIMLGSRINGNLIYDYIGQSGTLPRVAAVHAFP